MADIRDANTKIYEMIIFVLASLIVSFGNESVNYMNQLILYVFFVIKFVTHRNIALGPLSVRLSVVIITIKYPIIKIGYVGAFFDIAPI